MCQGINYYYNISLIGTGSIIYDFDGGLRYQLDLIPSTKEEKGSCKPPAAKPLTLTVDDLADVQNKVWEGRAKWYNIGLALKLTSGTLDAIRANYHFVEDCFLATLKEWLSVSKLHPSWSSLATALRDKTVGLEELAEQLPK